MPRRYPMPQDYSYPGNPTYVGGGLDALASFTRNFIQAYQAEQEKKAARTGVILDLLSEYGGEVSPEQMGEIESTLGFSKGKPSPIRSVFQPTYEEVRTPMQVAGETGGTETIDQISQGKLKGYKLPGKAEREAAKKKKELEIEYPYKEELKRIETESREKVENIRTQALSEKITAMQQTVNDKIASAEKIAADANSSKEQKTAADNEVKMAIAQMQAQVDLLKTQLTIKSKETMKGEEDKKAMSEMDKRKSFNDDMIKGGFLEKDGSFKALNREQANMVSQIAENYGYGYSEQPVKTGIAGLGAGGFQPLIDFKPRMTKEQKDGEKPAKEKQWKRVNVDELRKEAREAIRKGKDPLAVKKRFKEMTGEDLIPTK